MTLMQANKPIDPGTGEPIPNPKPDPRIPDDWPPKPPPPRQKTKKESIRDFIPARLPEFSKSKSEMQKNL